MEWIDLGTFCAEDERRVQQFPLETHVYAKYIKVRVVNSTDILYSGNDRQISRLEVCVYLVCTPSLSVSLSLSLSPLPPSLG